MRVVLAAAESLFPREDDFCFSLPGELLSLGTLVCSTPDARQECGCGRAFSGLESSYATTFGVVAEMDEAEVREKLHESPTAGSWARWATDQEPYELFWQELVALSDAISRDPLGTEVHVSVDERSFAIARPSTGAETAHTRPEGIHAFALAAVAASEAAGESSESDDDVRTVACAQHGRQAGAFICAHLIGGAEGRGFHSDEPTEDEPFPDAWCDECDALVTDAGGWDDVPEEEVNIVLVCGECYRAIKAANQA